MRILFPGIAVTSVYAPYEQVPYDAVAVTALLADAYGALYTAFLVFVIITLAILVLHHERSADARRALRQQAYIDGVQVPRTRPLPVPAPASNPQVTGLSKRDSRDDGAVGVELATPLETVNVVDRSEHRDASVGSQPRSKLRYHPSHSGTSPPPSPPSDGMVAPPTCCPSLNAAKGSSAGALGATTCASTLKCGQCSGCSRMNTGHDSGLGAGIPTSHDNKTRAGPTVHVQPGSIGNNQTGGQASTPEDATVSCLTQVMPFAYPVILGTLETLVQMAMKGMCLKAWSGIKGHSRSPACAFVHSAFSSMTLLTYDGESQLCHPAYWITLASLFGLTACVIWWLRKGLLHLPASRLLPVEYGTVTSTSSDHLRRHMSRLHSHWSLTLLVRARSRQ